MFGGMQPQANPLLGDHQADMDTLMKALTAGVPTGNTATQVGALQLENVNPVVNNATLDPNQHFDFYKWLVGNKLVRQGHAMLYQEVRRTSIGSPHTRRGTAEDAVAAAQDPSLGRSQWPLQVLQTGIQWGSIAATLGSNIVQARAGGSYTTQDEAEMAGAIRMLFMTTMNSFYGDNDLDDLEYDGIFKQIADDPLSTAGLNVIDMRGKPLTYELASWVAASMLTRKLAALDTIIATPTSLQSIANGYRDALRTNPGLAITGGSTFQGFVFQGGKNPVMPVHNLFMGPAQIPCPTAASSATDAPATPTIASIAASGSGSQYGSADAGSYIMKVIAVGTNGHHSAAATSSAQAVTAGQNLVLTITDSSITNVAYYVYFISKKDGAAGTAEYAGRVKKNPSGNTVITDTRAKIPGTSDVLLTSSNPQNGPVLQTTSDVLSIVIGNPTAVQRRVLAQAQALVLVNAFRNVHFKNVGEPELELDAA